MICFKLPKKQDLMKNQLKNLKIKKYFFMKKYVLSLKNILRSVVKGIRLKNDDLEIKTTPNNLRALLYFLQKHTLCQYTQLIEIACLDIPGKKRRFMVNYLLLSLRYNARLKIVLQINEVSSLFSTINLYRSANWLEREVWDLYGIFFEFHSDLNRILTDYSFPGHALRKDFPLTGFLEASYDARIKKLSYEPVELAQEFRTFNTQSPWIQKEKILNQVKLGPMTKHSQWVFFKHENILYIAEIVKIFFRWLFKQRTSSSGGQSQGHQNQKKPAHDSGKPPESPKKPADNSGKTPESPTPSPENQKKPADNSGKVPESLTRPPEKPKLSSENSVKSPENPGPQQDPSVKPSPAFNKGSYSLKEEIQKQQEKDRLKDEKIVQQRLEEKRGIKTTREKDDKEREGQTKAHENALVEIERQETQILNEKQATRRQIFMEKGHWSQEDVTEVRQSQDQALEKEEARQDTLRREEKVSDWESLRSRNTNINESLAHEKVKTDREKLKGFKNQIDQQTQEESDKSKAREDKRTKEEDALLEDMINAIKKK